MVKLKKNKRERLFQEAAIEGGYEILSRGWPDFLCYKESENYAVFVEIKRKSHSKTGKVGLTKFQKRMHVILKKLGLKVRTVYID